MMGFEEKCHKLTEFIHNCTKNDIAIAFSGGVDSSLLLKIACESAKINKTKVYAVTIHTMLNIVKEKNFTVEISKEMGAIPKIIEIDELNEAGITDNPKNRCYLCKKYMFSKIIDFAKSVNVNIILDGTNFDDLNTYRPGIKALAELGIFSPLAKLYITKEDVRKMAYEYNISASDKPSTPCLATRFEYGTKLSYDEIRKIEKAEEYITSLGFYNVRLRVHGKIARIEVDSTNLINLIQKKEDVISYLKTLGFKYVTVDLEGFVSGSMDR